MYSASGKVVAAESVSRVSDELASSETFVTDEDQIPEQQKAVIDKDLEKLINSSAERASIKTRIALTEDEVELVKAALDAQRTISHEDLTKILKKETNPLSDPARVNTNPLGRLCREISDAERDAADALGVQLPEWDEEDVPADADVDVPGSGVERIQSTDIPTYLARLTDTMTSPEESVLAGLEPHATQSSVPSSRSMLQPRISGEGNAA